MTEWTFFVAIVALVAELIAIVKPIISLTNAISKLNTNVEKLSQDLDDTIQNNIESHRRIWAHNDQQDKSLNDLDKRVAVLEERT